MALAYLHFSEKQKILLILIVTFLNCGCYKQVHYVVLNKMNTTMIASALNINKFDSSFAVYQ